MKKHGPKRILETKYLYCNKHGDCEHVFSVKKWKCCACTVDYSTKYRKARKIKAIDYKGGACELCGYSKSSAALTFHHRDSLLKSYEMSGTNLCKKWETLLIELNKCQLLCCNCHFELHAEEDKERKIATAKKPTEYNKKTIHRINCKKLGKRPTP